MENILVISLRLYLFACLRIYVICAVKILIIFLCKARQVEDIECCVQVLL